jgi:hypothetical protein
VGGAPRLELFFISYIIIKKMATTALDKCRRRAKQIQGKTGKSYQQALKQAGREYREGKVSGTKKKRKSPKRVGSAPKYKVYHEVRKVGKLTYKGGEFKIGALTIPQARQEVRQKLAWELLAKDSAKNVKARKEAAKKVKALKQLNTKLDKI